MNVSRTIYTEAPAGSSVDFAGTIIKGHLPEDGAAVSKHTYNRLYEAIGDEHGVHADPTLFYLPDSRSRVNMCENGIHLVGDKIGEETHLLTEAEMPVHTHGQNSHNHTVLTNNVGGAGNATSPTQFIANPTAGLTAPTTATNQNTGGGLAHNNMSPYLVLKKLIKY